MGAANRPLAGKAAASRTPDPSFKVFHDLMARRIGEILLVSSPYDAFIMEEDGRLAERIIHEYRGLNLTRPPRLTVASTAGEALELLGRRPFDLVITMPRLEDMAPWELGRAIKAKHPDLPVFLLSHGTGRLLADPRLEGGGGIDQVLVWRGTTDLLLALIKMVEDRMNVAPDTRRARVRVIILVEDSPVYISSLLPLLYREVVTQTQAVMEESLNEEHRLLRMRARPKILLARTFEEAMALYRTYRPFVLCILSDVRFERQGRLDEAAGFRLLADVKAKAGDLPLLILSSEAANREQALRIPAAFLSKDSPTLHQEIRTFFQENLGFGEFVFRLPDGREAGRAASLRGLEQLLATVPGEAVFYHAVRNHFSTWLMARSEIQLASRLRPVKATAFADAEEIRAFLLAALRERRRGRQKGVVTDFIPGEFDPEIEFLKIGRGSLGGKARGLAFMAARLRDRPLERRFPQVTIGIPQTLVISTEGFDAFMQENRLHQLPLAGMDDAGIAAAFQQARFPEWLRRDLAHFLQKVRCPLAVRSSSLLEDAQFIPSAGIYQTVMLPNAHPDDGRRLEALLKAVRRVWASTFFAAPRAVVRNTPQRLEEEKMAVMIQEVTGRRFGRLFLPAVSGVAQSCNFYPAGAVTPEDGMAVIAFGFGKAVVEGRAGLRFSPRHPRSLPQFAAVADILQNAQQRFYALVMDPAGEPAGEGEEGADSASLRYLNLDEAADLPPVKLLSSTYVPEDDCIRDTAAAGGYPVLTFAPVLKFGRVGNQPLPLAEILAEMLEIGKSGMGAPVEIEFAVNLPAPSGEKGEFHLLQIRPMPVGGLAAVEITPADRDAALAYAPRAMGNGLIAGLTDIVFVKPAAFDTVHTPAIAAEVSRLNRELAAAGQKYLLIGPGRWGTRDRWLGIPVGWEDISGVGAIVETEAEGLAAEPSQGTHFFHNLTSLGIGYLSVFSRQGGFLNWDWLLAQPPVRETRFLRHLRPAGPVTVKIDGQSSRAVVLPARKGGTHG